MRAARGPGPPFVVQAPLKPSSRQCKLRNDRVEAKWRKQTIKKDTFTMYGSPRKGGDKGSTKAVVKYTEAATEDISQCKIFCA